MGASAADPSKPDPSSALDDGALGDSAGARPLLIEELDVGATRVDALVRVSSDHWMRTSAFPGTAERTLEALPGISKHRCECGSDHGISAELAATETPHLLEHVALELMVLAGSPRTLRGDTRWDFASDGHGVFHVLLDYDDDLVALGALKEAALAIPLLLGQGEDLFDVEPVLSRLRMLRRVSPK